MKEATTFLTENGALYFIIIITVMFISSTLFLMIQDYRLFLDEQWQKKPGFTDFVRQEQIYLYALLFFVLLILGEWWVWTIAV